MNFLLCNNLRFWFLQVNTTMDTFMCYGPVVPDGYGVCYNPHPNDIIVVISAFKSHAETQSDYFAYTLEGSLLQMKELCLKTREDYDAVADKIRNTSLHNGSMHENGSAGKMAKQLVRQNETEVPNVNGRVKGDSP